jgi:hypothetical protein
LSDVRKKEIVAISTLKMLSGCGVVALQAEEIAGLVF